MGELDPCVDQVLEHLEDWGSLRAAVFQEVVAGLGMDLCRLPYQVRS